MYFPCKTCCENNASCCHNPQIIWSMTELDNLVTSYPDIMDKIVIFKGEMPGMVYLISREAIQDNPKVSSLDYCAFYDTQEMRCSIYENRPFICRTYGDPKYNNCPYEGMTEMSLLDLIKNNKELAKTMHRTAGSNPEAVLNDYIFPFVDQFKISDKEYHTWWEGLPSANFIRK